MKTELPINQILPGDALARLKELPSNSVHCCVTSPPYWGLRDYGMNGQLGLEKTPDEFIAKLIAIFEEVRRILRKDGTCWVNMGDSYASGPRDRTREQAVAKSTLNGTTVSQEQSLKQINKINGEIKPKDLVGIPWMLAFALRSAGWYLRQDIIWHKPNPMPESVTDRCTKAHEYIFLLSKSRNYFYDAEAIKEEASTNSHARIARAKEGHKTMPSEKINGLRPRKLAEAGSGTTLNTSFDAAMVHMVEQRNKRSVWSVNSQAMSEAHFATFPERLIDDCIKAGTSEHGCCSECGAPWERLVSSEKNFMSGSGKSGNPINGKNGEHLQGGGTTGDIRKGPTLKTETIGWQPACNCEGGGIVPCVVLDPFSGAGTTMLVTRKLGRSGIGIELNPAYIKIATKRLKKELGMFYEPIDKVPAV
jgi:DNA modification methylase